MPIPLWLAALVVVVLALGILIGYQWRLRVQWNHHGVHLVQKVNCSGCGERVFNPEFTHDGYPLCRPCGRGDDRK